MERNITTKYVELSVQLVFVGDYYDADEVAGVATDWIYGTLDDRDDLQGVTVRTTRMREVPGDPEKLR